MKKLFLSFLIALSLAGKLKADNLDKAVALGVGAGTAYLLDLLPGDAPKYGPLGHRVLVVAWSLGLGIAYEAARPKADRGALDQENLYSSALGTLGVVTFRF